MASKVRLLLSLVKVSGLVSSLVNASVTIAVAAAASVSTALGARSAAVSPSPSVAARRLEDGTAAASRAAAARSATLAFRKIQPSCCAKSVSSIETETVPRPAKPKRAPGRYPSFSFRVSTCAAPPGTPARSRSICALARSLRGSARFTSFGLRVVCAFGSPKSRHPLHKRHCAHRGFSTSKSGSSLAKTALESSNKGHAPPKLNQNP
mmetsp:Transcript_10190/g.37732  ORF Transcript_10190/g.37732 Transcript_10190/m.37732 type:complete len:208 (+) Transcript_10190:1210-1833(+)